LTVFFTLLDSTSVKTVRRTLMKLTPAGINAAHKILVKLTTGLHEEVMHQINYAYPPELQSQTSERTTKESQSFCLDVLKRKSSRGLRRFSSNDSKQSSASTNTISSNEQGPTNSRSPGVRKLIVLV
jgi:hypothetical protein